MKFKVFHGGKPTFDKSDFLNQLLIYEEYGSIRWKSQMFLKKMIQQKV